MTIRTTSLAVQGILVDNYGPRADGTLPDLTPFIESASGLVDNVVTIASADKGITLGTTTQELIERWLAAYFYCKADPTYASRTTEGASGNFDNDPKIPERYRKGAEDMDYSGTLSALLSQSRAGGFWLGQDETDKGLNAQGYYTRWQ